MCRTCTDSTCRDAGSESEPIEIECPACNGHGCDQCDEGSVSVTTCPNKYCREMAPLITLADLFAKGLPPVGGGVLDQAAWFLHAAQILERDEDTIKAERNNRS